MAETPRKTTSQAARVLKLLQLVQGESWHTARDLARACAVTRRQVFRDLKTLQEAGIPVSYCDRTRRYRVLASRSAASAVAVPQIDAVGFSAEQACMLLGVVGQLAGETGIPLLAPAREVIERLRAAMPARLRRELVRFEKRVYVHVTADEDDGQYADVFAAVRRAILDGRVLRCRYASGRKGSRSLETFELRPYGLAYVERGWYVIGHHSGHDEVRTLKLSRFAELAMTDDSYRIPRDFEIKRYFRQAWRMIPGQKRYDVELTLDARFAESAAETRWHATRAIQWNADGTLRFSCQVDGLEEICWWVLSMGPHCTVRAPAELAGRVARLAGETARRYAPRPVRERCSST